MGRSETSVRCRLDCGVSLEFAAEAGRLAKGEPVSIGIRPENARVGEDKAADLTTIGTIDLVEHLGESQILYLDLPGESEKFLVKVDGELTYARMQNIPLTARLQDMHVFDVEGSVVSVLGRHGA